MSVPRAETPLGTLADVATLVDADLDTLRSVSVALLRRAGLATPAHEGAVRDALVARVAFERAGGVCEDYIIGDYEDSDFCLRVRETGGTIFYVPEAELFHFERRSIRLHAGYARTHASLYNRLLHNARWDAAMDAAMSGAVRARGRAA